MNYVATTKNMQILSDVSMRALKSESGKSKKTVGGYTFTAKKQYGSASTIVYVTDNSLNKIVSHSIFDYNKKD